MRGIKETLGLRRPKPLHALVFVFPTIWEPGTGYNLGQKGLRIFEIGGYFTHYPLPPTTNVDKARFHKLCFV